MDDSAVNRALKRISFEIEEKNKGFDSVCLIGILSRGYPLAKKIANFIKENEDIDVPIGTVDITGFRDDRERADKQNFIGETNISFDINGKTCVLVDDVIFTGRTVRAAIDALFNLGRPDCIQLAVLVDRGHRELPIRPDYVGKNIPTSSSESVCVWVPEIDSKSGVEIYKE